MFGLPRKKAAQSVGKHKKSTKANHSNEIWIDGHGGTVRLVRMEQTQFFTSVRIK